MSKETGKWLQLNERGKSNQVSSREKIFLFFCALEQNIRLSLFKNFWQSPRWLKLSKATSLQDKEKKNFIQIISSNDFHQTWVYPRRGSYYNNPFFPHSFLSKPLPLIFKRKRQMGFFSSHPRLFIYFLGKTSFFDSFTKNSDSASALIKNGNQEKKMIQNRSHNCWSSYMTKSKKMFFFSISLSLRAFTIK